MAITDLRQSTENEFMPDKDVIKRLGDGREIVIARAGTPIPKAQAIELGLIKPEKAKPAAEPSENKSQQPAAENKGKGETSNA